MALPNIQQPQVSDYSRDAMQRRLQKRPNQFTAGGMSPLGGQ